MISVLLEKDYRVITFAEYLRGEKPNRFVILRHDVDRKPENSLAVAKIEKELGVKTSYYFRAVSESWDNEIIREIASLGHEIGYHYESLTTCKGNLRDAYKDFEQNLARLRALVPVQTICMHGSPRSPYDSRNLWKGDKSYKDLGITGEPYFDVDFSDVFYLTDTGRRWDGFKVSVRDKIEKFQDVWAANGLIFHSTDDILRALESGTLPHHLMITTHPQRWNSSPLPWIKEYIIQNIKNTIKFLLINIKTGRNALPLH